MKSRKFGRILVEKKALTEHQLMEALQEQGRVNAQSKRKFKLGEILLFCKLINVTELQRTLLEQRDTQ